MEAPKEFGGVVGHLIPNFPKPLLFSFLLVFKHFGY
jgi:hypothetical protein